MSLVSPKPKLPTISAHASVVILVFKSLNTSSTTSDILPRCCLYDLFQLIVKLFHFVTFVRGNRKDLENDDIVMPGEDGDKTVENVCTGDDHFSTYINTLKGIYLFQKKPLYTFPPRNLYNSAIAKHRNLQEM